MFGLSVDASEGRKSRPVTRLQRGFGVAVVLLCVALVPASCGRLYRQAPVAGAPIAGDEIVSMAFLVGDFGRPSAPFEDLVGVLGKEAAALVASAPRTPPMILALGDNLYEDGLPRLLEAPRAQRRIGTLLALAERFVNVRYAGAQVPLVLIPGNHDYADDALTYGAQGGDISRWYFLHELGVAGAAAWTQVPGDAAAFGNAAALAAHLEGDPAAHAAFMAPAPVPHLNDDLHVVAIDSELILSLYDHGHPGIADEYWRGLERRLAAAPAGAWVMIAAHHPPVTYGKHGRPAWGNWVFGQGWPQFPKAWQRLLAVATPAAVVLAAVVHPAIVALAALPPATTALVSGRKQDVGSVPYDRYAAELLRLAEEHGVDVVLAGHDHNTQFIELASLDGYDEDTLLVITGAGAKVDPVRRGTGTVAFLADYSFVRMTQYAGGLAFEIVDRSGTTRFRYNLRR